MANCFRTVNIWLFTGFSAAALFLCPSQASAADTLIAPDDPAINYYGRFDFSNPKAPRFDWCASTIEFMVSGATTVGMEMIDGAGYYDVEVDGVAGSAPVYASSWSSKKYALVSALSTGPHVVRIIRRNEPYWAIATFSGIYLPAGGKVLPLAKPTRKMEFCGDSWTAGYFVEACADQQLNTNANKAWARITSKAFKAQDVILAESGICLTQLPGGRTSFPRKYPGTFDTTGGIPTPLWNFSSWTPDIVSIFLGINDRSAGVTESQFTAALHGFVTTLLGNYPDATILFIAATGCMDQAARAAVTAETTTLGHPKVYFLECKTAVTGCQYHPTVGENRKIADSVIAKIRQITGWDTTQNTVSRGEIKTISSRASTIKAAPLDPCTILISAQKGAAGNTIRVSSANGRIVEQLRLDQSGACRWNAGQTSDGVYFIGAPETGWTRVFIR